ncbi:MAG: M50 family metallopeptidase [Selenomonadales bacterium]|nr:M50 family metallopeptidase [Selenomonadales bacterium]
MKILTVRGVAIHVHYLFCLLAAVFGICGQMMEVIIIFLCVIFHELCHITTAVWLGYRVTRLELLPFGGAAMIDGLASSGWREIMMILAGPIGSALGGAVCYWGLKESGEVVRLALETNMMLFLWNLLPAYPLDGGRILRILLGYMMTQKEAVKRTVRISHVVAAVLLFYAIYALIADGEVLVSMMILAGMIIRLSGAEGANRSFLPFYAMAGKRRIFLEKGYALTKWYTVDSKMRAGAVVELFQPQTYAMVRIVTSSGEEYGILSETAIWQGLERHQLTESIEKFCERKE